MSDGKSFADMLASTRRQQEDRRLEADDLPRVSRPFPSVKDQDCESGYAEGDCDGEVFEGDEAAFVNGEIACESCFTQAQQIRDDFFDNR